MFSYLSIFFLLIIGAVCAYNAKLRGRNPTAWFAIGFFFGAIGLLILFLIPPKREPVSSMAASSPGKPIPEVSPQVEPSLTTSQASHSTPQKLWYYLDDDNERFGPMSFDRLKRAWIEDQVTRDTYLWNEDMEDWKTVKDLPELLDQLGEMDSPN